MGKLRTRAEVEKQMEWYREAKRGQSEQYANGVVLKHRGISPNQLEVTASMIAWYDARIGALEWVLGTDEYGTR
jgi:hypothetical protein